MEVFSRPGTAKFRVIVRDHRVNPETGLPSLKSRSFGVYSSEYDLESLLRMMKKYLEKVEEKE